MLEKKIEKYTVMNIHMELVRRGRFLEARNILMFLTGETETLELGASDWGAERMLECSNGRINCIYICRKEKKEKGWQAQGWKVLDRGSAG